LCFWSWHLVVVLTVPRIPCKGDTCPKCLPCALSMACPFWSWH
jgi:hypothetical protein